MTKPRGVPPLGVSKERELMEKLLTAIESSSSGDLCLNCIGRFYPWYSEDHPNHESLGEPEETWGAAAAFRYILAKTGAPPSGGKVSDSEDASS